MFSKGFTISNMAFGYGPVPCLTSIDCVIEPARFYGLIGPNGSGKSTLLDLMTGFLTPSSGSISLNGTRLSEFSRRALAQQLSSVPQSYLFNFDYSVYDAVLMGRYPHIPRFSNPSRDDLDKVNQALDAMQVNHLRDRSIRHLSGGEKQRVMLARVLAQDTEFTLLDEITANLDINHGISIMHTLAGLVKDSGRTVIAAIHDLNMALAFCDDLIVLKEGRLAAIGPTDTVLTETMVQDLYQVQSELLPCSDGSTHLRFRYEAR